MSWNVIIPVILTGTGILPSSFHSKLGLLLRRNPLSGILLPWGLKRAARAGSRGLGGTGNSLQQLRVSDSKPWASKEGLPWEPKGPPLWFSLEEFVTIFIHPNLSEIFWAPPRGWVIMLMERFLALLSPQPQSIILAVGLTQGQWLAIHLVNVSAHLPKMWLLLPCTFEETHDILCLFSYWWGDDFVFFFRRDIPHTWTTEPWIVFFTELLGFFIPIGSIPWSLTHMSLSKSTC